MIDMIHQQRIADPDQLVEAIRGAELEPWLLSGQEEESMVSRVQLPGSWLESAVIGPAMWFRGVMPKDCYTMIFVRECPEDGHSFNFKTRHRHDCMGFFAPGEALDAKTPAGYGQTTLLIPAEVFDRVATTGFPEMPDGLRKRGRHYFPAMESCRRLNVFLDQMEGVIRSTPGVLVNDASREALESELHEHFFRLMQGGDVSRGAEGGMKVSHRNLRAGLLRDYIRANVRRPIRLRELCEASGLSRRSLEYLFIEVFGVHLAEFLLRLRLNGVRRELVEAHFANGQVKKIALDWGFWHLGRFAAQYQAFFGEKPSETLKRHG
jgi:AraC-like DNA-binding protein